MEPNSRSTLFPVLAVLLLLLDPIFGQILPAGLSIGTFLTGTALVTLWFIGNRAWNRIQAGIIGTFWVIFAVYIAISHFLIADGFSRTVPVLISAILIMIMASASAEWVQPALQILILLLAIHAIATVFFYFAPQIYFSQIKNRFFADNYGATGYMSGLTSHYSYNAMFCTLGFLLAGVKALFAQVSVRTKWGYWILTFFFLFAIVLTTKRAHIIFGVIALALVFLISNAQGRVFKIALGATLAFAALFWVASYSEGVASSLDRLMGTFEATDIREATSGRTLLWEAALQGWHENPILGKGWQSFHFYWPGGVSESFHAHNQLLNLLYEAGIVGVVLFLIAAFGSIISTARTMRRLHKSKVPATEHIVGVAAAFVIQLFLLMYALTSGELLTSNYVFIPYFVAVAMGYALQSVKTEVSTVERNTKIIYGSSSFGSR